MDFGSGDRQMRHLAIANFALQRSNTQALMGGLHASAIVMPQGYAEARMVIDFLLNPRNQPHAVLLLAQQGAQLAVQRRSPGTAQRTPPHT